MAWRYETSPSFEVLGSREELIVEAVSSRSMHTLVGTKDLRLGYVNRRARHVLFEGGGSKLGFGRKI
jgi:hypothetical protein